MDQWLFRVIHGLRRPWLDKIFGPIAEWGDLFPLVLFTVALLYKRDKKTGAIARDGVLSWLSAFWVAEMWIKPLVKRTRPPNTPSLRGFVHVLGTAPSAKSLSFPSGAATMAFAGATIVWLAWGRRAGIAAMIAATLVGLSRVYIGVHFPGDIAGAAVIGSAVAYGLWRLSKWSSG